MVSKWVPEDERSAFISFAYVGGTFGSVITNPMCGLIIAKLGWEVRYLCSSFSLLLMSAGSILRDGSYLCCLVFGLVPPGQ